MSNKEVIAELKDWRKTAVNHGSYYGEKAVDVYDTAISALEKQIPKKAVLKLHENRIDGEQEEYHCPTCGEWLSWNCAHFKHCYECGQAIDWRGYD